MCVCIHARACACVRKCLCGNVCLFLLLSTFYFCNTLSHWTWSCLIHLILTCQWAPLTLQTLPSHPAIGLQMQTTRPNFILMCVLGIKPRSSCLCSQHSIDWTSSPPLYIIPIQFSCTKPVKTHSPFILPNLALRSPWSRRQQVETEVKSSS